jgi:predicted GIY-YIG superfamily endonuclease
MYTTYVIKNRRNKKYTGSTEDLDERLQIHNDVDPQPNFIRLLLEKAHGNYFLEKILKPERKH